MHICIQTYINSHIHTLSYSSSSIDVDSSHTALEERTPLHHAAGGMPPNCSTIHYHTLSYIILHQYTITSIHQKIISYIALHFITFHYISLHRHGIGFFRPHFSHRDWIWATSKQACFMQCFWDWTPRSQWITYSLNHVKFGEWSVVRESWTESCCSRRGWLRMGGAVEHTWEVH